MKLLFIGDIFGRPGRDLVKAGIRGLVAHHRIDLVIANGENSAGGFGITREIGEELFARGIDVMTSGNHVWDKKEALDYIPLEPRLLRPANYPGRHARRRALVARTRHGDEVGVVNVMGRVFMPTSTTRSPSAAREVAAAADAHADRLRRLPRRGHLREDRHGLVSRRPGHRGGRHPHPRADRRRALLPGGTAYITDVGMTGPHDGVIGVERERGARHVPDRAADALRDRHRQPAAARCRDRAPTRDRTAPASSA